MNEFNSNTTVNNASQAMPRPLPRSRFTSTARQGERSPSSANILTTGMAIPTTEPPQSPQSSQGGLGVSLTRSETPSSPPGNPAQTPLQANTFTPHLSNYLQDYLQHLSSQNGGRVIEPTEINNWTQDFRAFVNERETQRLHSNLMPLHNTWTDLRNRQEEQRVAYENRRGELMNTQEYEGRHVADLAEDNRIIRGVSGVMANFQAEVTRLREEEGKDENDPEVRELQTDIANLNRDLKDARGRSTNTINAVPERYRADLQDRARQLAQLSEAKDEQDNGIENQIRAVEESINSSRTFSNAFQNDFMNRMFTQLRNNPNQRLVMMRHGTDGPYAANLVEFTPREGRTIQVPAGPILAVTLPQGETNELGVLRRMVPGSDVDVVRELP